MNKISKIALLLLTLIFITTYSPNYLTSNLETENQLFGIKEILISKNKLIKKEDILEKLDKIYDKNIFLVKEKDIKKPLEKINFLDKITVKKKFPNTVLIKIYETLPVGILFEDKSKYILDSSSNIIEYDKNLHSKELPNIFGNDAKKHFVNFLNQLETNSFPKEKIKDFYYFQIGRWDIHLDSNKVIKFPHNLNNNIIQKSIELLNRKDFENYKIIDLRVDGKIIVE